MRLNIEYKEDEVLNLRSVKAIIIRKSESGEITVSYMGRHDITGKELKGPFEISITK